MKLFVSTIFMLLALSVSAQFSLQGKLRTLRPLTIKVTDLAGNVITECPVNSNKEFKTKPVHIQKDLYIVHFGKYTEKIIFTDSPVILSGFLNEDKPEESYMDFKGIDLHLKYLEISEKCWEDGKGFIHDVFRSYAGNDATLDPVVRATLAYEKKRFLGHDYETFKQVLDRIPENEREGQVIKCLVDEVVYREKIALGTQAHDFTFVDIDGKEISLSDFRGKLVLLDFSASWCGGCRTEAKHLKPIYNGLKGDDLVFISVSLDNREKDWRRMVEEDKLPWMTLWDSEGFTKGNKKNKIQEAYGFYQIPFIVLIDKDGKIIARDLRGDKVKEAIEKARKSN